MKRIYTVILICMLIMTAPLLSSCSDEPGQSALNLKDAASAEPLPPDSAKYPEQVINYYYKVNGDKDMVSSLNCLFPEYRQLYISHYGSVEALVEAYENDVDTSEKYIYTIQYNAVDKNLYADGTDKNKDLAKKLADDYSINEELMGDIYVYDLTLTVNGTNAPFKRYEYLACYDGKWYVIPSAEDTYADTTEAASTQEK